MADGSFEEFYHATYGRLLRQLILGTGDRSDAEDLLQDAYGRAAVRWRRLRDYQAPEAWVRRVALRLATDRARRARRRAAALLRLRPPRPPSVELLAESLDLYDALRGLPAGQRQAVVLHYLVGLPVEEVASQLNLPVGTWRLPRLRERQPQRRGYGRCGHSTPHLGSKGHHGRPLQHRPAGHDGPGHGVQDSGQANRRPGRHRLGLRRASGTVPP